jgi:hypothetical protein
MQCLAVLCRSTAAAGITRAWAWMIRRIARVRGVQRNRPAAAAANVNSPTRREFIGAVAALAPPLFTVGLTGVALAQLSHFRVRRFTLSIPTLPRALDGITIAHVTDMHVGGSPAGGCCERWSTRPTHSGPIWCY